MWSRLKECNWEFSASLYYETQRKKLLEGQNPVAVVLCCLDSRVPPEIIFDINLRQLFVVRMAGHVIDDTVLGSIEYAIEHLDPYLVIVLGHEKCGAVHAALDY